MIIYEDYIVKNKGFLALEAPPKHNLKNITKGLIYRQNLMCRTEKVRSIARNRSNLPRHKQVSDGG